MLKTTKLLTILVALYFLAVSCQNNQTPNVPDSNASGSHKAEVAEVIHTSSYTYLLVKENNKEQWIAISKQEIEEGAVVYYKDGLEMQNFESKELGRTFETVYFVQEISLQPIDDNHANVMGSSVAQKPTLSKVDVSIDKPEGGITIGELYSNKSKFNGQTIVVRGKVTKVNTAIMNRNWIHLQDGSGDENHFDLTVTSDDIPTVGDVVTYSGVVVLDQDFGLGYEYELLLEQAVRIKE
ncbi:MAG: hypothetical protein R2764_25355 [Bacteroidales bacterium]